MFSLRKKEKNESIKYGWIRLVKELKGNKKQFFTVFVLAVVLATVDAWIKKFLGKTIDAATSEKIIDIFGFSLKEKFLYPSLLAVAIFIDEIGSALYFGYYQKILAFDMYKKYLEKVFSKVVYYPVSFFKNNGLGKVSYSITNGSEKIKNLTIDLSGNPFFMLK